MQFTTEVLIVSQKGKATTGIANDFAFLSSFQLYNIYGKHSY